MLKVCLLSSFYRFKLTFHRRASAVVFVSLIYLLNLSFYIVVSPFFIWKEPNHGSFLIDDRSRCARGVWTQQNVTAQVAYCALDDFICPGLLLSVGQCLLVIKLRSEIDTSLLKVLLFVTQSCF